MIFYIVTERATDRAILVNVLRPVFAETGLRGFGMTGAGTDPPRRIEWIDSAGTKSGALSLAWSAYVTHRIPVILVANADSSDEAMIRERRDFLETYLGQTVPKDRFRVCMAIPAVEECLFSDVRALEQILGRELTDPQKARAPFQPREVLMELLGPGPRAYSMEAIDRLLKGKDTTPFHQSKFIQEIIAAMREFAAVVPDLPVGRRA
jgi:hypothetical protein